MTINTHLYLDRLLASELANQPPWLWVTSRELAKALRVHLQTLANWRVREVGPPPAPPSWFRGKACRYRIDVVLSWAYETAGDDKNLARIQGEWLRDHLGFEDWRDVPAVQARVQTLMGLGRQFRPANLTRQGREALDTGGSTHQRPAAATGD